MIINVQCLFVLLSLAQVVFFKRLLESSLESNVWASTHVIDRSNVLALALTQLLRSCQTFLCKQYCITFVMTNGQNCLISTKDKANPQQNFSNSSWPYIRQTGSGLFIRASLDSLQEPYLPTTDCTIDMDNWINTVLLHTLALRCLAFWEIKWSLYYAGSVVLLVCYAANRIQVLQRRRRSLHKNYLVPVSSDNFHHFGLKESELDWVVHHYTIITHWQFGNLTSFDMSLNLNHLSPSQGYFWITL